MWQIEIDQVVTEQEVRAISEVVEFCQCRCQVAAAKDQWLVNVRTHCGKCVNAVILLADFEVQREKGGRETWDHSNVHIIERTITGSKMRLHFCVAMTHSASLGMPSRICASVA